MTRKVISALSKESYSRRDRSTQDHETPTLGSGSVISLTIDQIRNLVCSKEKMHLLYSTFLSDSYILFRARLPLDTAIDSDLQSNTEEYRG